MVRQARGVILVAVAAACSKAPAPDPSANGSGSGSASAHDAPAAGPAVTLRVAYSSEKKAWLEQAIPAFLATHPRTPNGKPIAIDARSFGSGEALPPSPLKQVALELAFSRPSASHAAYQAALHHWERLAAMLGMVAIALALVAAIRRDHRGLIACALALGGVVLLWHYIVAALVVAIVLMIAVAHA